MVDPCLVMSCRRNPKSKREPKELWGKFDESGCTVPQKRFKWIIIHGWIINKLIRWPAQALLHLITEQMKTWWACSHLEAKKITQCSYFSCGSVISLYARFIVNTSNQLTLYIEAVGMRAWILTWHFISYLRGGRNQCYAPHTGWRGSIWQWFKGICVRTSLHWHC